MIRIQLITEGKVVKQISSRVHETVVLEQLKKYPGTVDEIIYEGEMSEDAKAILQKVAKRVIPAAMAAGIALGNANSAQAQNYFPGTNQSIGQHVADIFNPNYREIQRQRKAERDTRHKEQDAYHKEIRRARVDQARQQGRQDSRSYSGSEMPSGTKVYDQARLSGDGRHIILYDLDHRVIRIDRTGTEFIPADSQRLAHYITRGGQVYYVRHAATARREGVEGIVEDPTVGTIPAKGPTANTPNKTTTQQDTDDEQAGLELDKDHGLDKQTLDAIKKAGVAVDIKEEQPSRLEQRIRGVSESVNEGFTDEKLQDILDKHEASWQAFKSGGDITDNDQFYDDLMDYFIDSGEMPYGVATGDEDGVNWITNALDRLAGNEEIGEMKDDDMDVDQASAADQASADKNIIMQIRKAADYEKPTKISLDDGTGFVLDARKAKKILNMFDHLKPDSKALMQQVLNKQDGIKQILGHLGESVTESGAEGSEQNVTVYGNDQGYYAWTPNSGVLALTSDGKPQMYWDDLKGDSPQVQQYVSKYMKPMAFNTLPSQAQRIIGRKLFNQGGMEASLQRYVNEYPEEVSDNLEALKAKAEEEMAGTRNNWGIGQLPDGRFILALMGSLKKWGLPIKAQASVNEAPNVAQYASLADVYPEGSTEIWYWKEDFARDAMMGAKFMTKQGVMPTPDSVPNNYVLIGKMRETNPDKIFHMMQGEIWSPEGQANAMIKSSGTGHTSMSVGDIIHVGNKWMMVDRYGFHTLGDEPLEDSVQFESTYFDPKKTAAAIASRIIEDTYK